MSEKVKPIIFLFFGLSLCVGVRQADAQKPKRPARESVPFQATGTVEAIAMGAIKMQQAGTQDFWVVQLGKATEIHVTGTAEPEVLVPGIFVQFSAQVDRRGRVQGKVAKLLIFTPSTERIPGIFPDQTGGAGFGAEEGKKDPKGTTGYQIGGRITGCKKGKLAIHAGTNMIQCELADELEIEVDIADYRFAKQGDKIEVSGTLTDEKRKIGLARTVFIELTEPLAGPQKKKPRRTKPSKQKESSDDPNEKEKPDKKKDDPDEKEKPDKKKDDPDEKEKPEPADTAVADDNPERTRKLAKLLSPKGDAESTSFDLPVGKGDKPLTFKTSVRGPAQTLRRRFGKPDKIVPIQHKVTSSDGDEETVKFKLWVWGPVKMLVGDDGKARFFAVEE